MMTTIKHCTRELSSHAQRNRDGTCAWGWQRLVVATQPEALSHAALHWQRPGQRSCRTPDQGAESI